MAADEDLEVVRYFALPNGGVGTVTAPTRQHTTLPTGATEITADEYDQLLGEVEAGNAASLAEMQAADSARQQADYDELTGIGVSADLAARLTGHQPDPA